MGDGERYSFSLTTFSPSGKLAQIEYALAAVAAGAPTIGIRGAWNSFPMCSFLELLYIFHGILFFSCSAFDGAVVATEKKQKNQLFEEDTVVKVESVSKNIGMVYSGMGPDFRYAFPFSFFLKYW